MLKRTQQVPIEVRDGSPGESTGNRLVGYAARYDLESAPLYDRSVCDTEFVEVLAPGAFARTLRDNPDIAALYNHDTNCVLGRTSNGTLTLTEDDQGLAFEVELPQTSYAQDVKALVARGDIQGCSFGFTVVEDEVQQRPGDLPLRIIKDLCLFEISPAVCFPAYQDTEVSVRAKGKAKTTPRRDYCERLLKIKFA